MAFSLVIDDTSLVLLLSLIAVVSISIYVSRSYQPLIHPLILSRQADVSQVRQPKESAVYRNANTPSGFDLALRPRKDVNDIADLLKHASVPSAGRTIFGRSKSNADIAGDATAFATGFLQLSSAPVPQTAFAIVSEKDSYESLIALMANTHTSASSPFHTFVLPPTSSPTVLPSTVSSSGARSVIGVYTTAQSISAALGMSFLDPSALIIVPSADLEDVQRRVGLHFGGSHRLRIYSYDHVVKTGSRGSLLSPNASTREGILQVQSYFWNVHAADWVEVQHSHLIAGVTAQLAMFPADKIPTAADRLLVETSTEPNSPASVLMATRSPAGFALALVALYTAASITTNELAYSYDNPEASLNADFVAYKPTLIYASAQGSSSLACALTSFTRKSPFASFAARNKLYTLRNGSYSRRGIIDGLVYSNARRVAGCEQVRSLCIIGLGDTIAQALLDSLRSHLGCAVLNAYLPLLSCGAAMTAPVSATHAFDLQAFAEHELEAMQVPAHVGPPTVAVELKLVQNATAAHSGIAVFGQRLDGHQGDPIGQIIVQGYLVAGTKGDWVSTGDLGAIRSNGTLVVLRSAHESEPVPVPTIHSRKPVLRQRRTKTVGKSLAAAALVTSLFLAASVPTTSASGLRKRASINGTMTNVAKMAMLTGQRASWEQGVGQSALLELDYPGYSVFTSTSGGPPFRPGYERNPSNPPVSVVSMAYHSASRQDSLGRLAFQITGDEVRNAGSSLDGASSGSEVLLAAWIAGQINQETGEEGTGFYIEAAQRTLDLVLQRTPRDSDGAISHRYTEVALWSDAMYMMPPFVAYYGMLTRNESLLQTAYDQIRLYRNQMRFTNGSGKGLWGHIVLGNGTWTDPGPWCTGNGWVSAGMLRVLATIEQSQSSLDMVDQKEDLVTWINEILDAAYPLLDTRALLWHNYMNDTSDFFDSAGSALLAYSTYRLASMVKGNDKWISVADQIYDSLATSLDTIGQFRTGYPVTDVLAFTHQGETSSESLSFLMLMAAAKRDYMNNDVVRVSSVASATNAAPLPPVYRAALPTLLLALFATLISLF